MVRRGSSNWISFKVDRHGFYYPPQKQNSGRSRVSPRTCPHTNHLKILKNGPKVTCLFWRPRTPLAWGVIIDQHPNLKSSKILKKGPKLIPPGTCPLWRPYTQLMRGVIKDQYPNLTISKILKKGLKVTRSVSFPHPADRSSPRRKYSRICSRSGDPGHGRPGHGRSSWAPGGRPAWPPGAISRSTRPF